MKNIKKQREKEDMNKEDVSKFNVNLCHDWSLPEVRIKNTYLIIAIGINLKKFCLKFFRFLVRLLKNIINKYY